MVELAERSGQSQEAETTPISIFNRQELPYLKRGVKLLLRDSRYPAEAQLDEHGMVKDYDDGNWGPPDGLTRERIQAAFGKLHDPHASLTQGDLFTISTSLLILEIRLGANGRQGWTHPELARVHGKVLKLQGADNPVVTSMLNAS